MVIGIGYDIHKLVKGRRLILGGISISASKGLAGHSDGDVLLHSICDSILGAIGEGDIGTYFPDTDSRYKGISSLLLLEKVWNIAKRKGYKIGNIDVTIICEKPKLVPYFPQMKKKIGGILPLENINLKAKSNNGLGALGRGEGIAAICVCLLEEVASSK